MTVSALRWFKIALIFQIALIAYGLTISVVDLFPWNDVSALPAGRELGRIIAGNALPLLVYLAIFALGVRALGILSIVGLAGYLLWQFWTWWKPYFIGADAAYLAYYTEHFSRTLKLLPAHAANLPPDAQHLVLQLLALVTLLVTAMAVARMQHL
jgi:hypothetical protein